MKLRLNPERGLPIYAQIVDSVRHLVATGELKPGEQLPTVRDLAAQLGVNVNTVARAYDMLDKAGVISTQQGRGCYIADRPDEQQLGRHRRRALRAIAEQTLLEALSLGYTVGEVEEALTEQLKQWKQAQRNPRLKSK
jgi:GntR family transcriptional regulator